jgi:hypothetical protein
LRRLRIAAPVQLPLALPEVVSTADRWWSLPEPTQANVLALLARLIAKGVVDEEADGD